MTVSLQNPRIESKWAYFDFDGRANTYSGKNALFLAKLSYFIYEHPDDFEALVRKVWEYPKFNFIERIDTEADTQCAVIGNDSHIIVVFRGTEGKVKDWLTDADSDKQALEDFGGHVHQGFYEGFRPVEKDVMQTVRAFRDNGQSIWVTGHSLGGALATLCAAILAKEGMSADGIYTFGQPRVGDQEFVDAYNKHYPKRHFRFVNNNDIVTRVPTRSMGFHHVGKFVYFTAEGELKDDNGFWDTFWDRAQGMFNNLGDFDFVPDSIEDHLMGNYISLSAKNIGNFVDDFKDMA